MALLKPVEPKQQDLESDIDLTLCGICLEPVNDPKDLPCLHTFCFGCIKEWNRGKTDQVKCPVCKEDFPLSPGGVSQLKTNLFVEQLKKKQEFKDKLAKKTVQCTFCDKTDDTAIARCVDCNEYLCISCVEAHKTYKILKGHNVVSFKDIETNKIDLHTTLAEELCTKHKGQVMWFFCETCGHLICRDCTVADHPASTHNLVNIEDVSGTHIQKLKELSSKCQIVTRGLDNASKSVGEVQHDLEKALEIAKKQLDHATANIKSEFLKHLNDEQQKISDKIDNIASHNKSNIKLDSDRLQSQRLQLDRALKVTTQVIETGSPFDIAAMYTTLTDTMQRLSVMKPVNVEKTLSLVQFSAAKKLPFLQNVWLGTVVDGYKESQLITWLSSVKFADNQEVPRLGRKSASDKQLSTSSTTTSSGFYPCQPLAKLVDSTSASSGRGFSFDLPRGLSTTTTRTSTTSSGGLSFDLPCRSSSTTTTTSATSGSGFSFGSPIRASTTISTTSATETGRLNFGLPRPLSTTTSTTSATGSDMFSFGLVSPGSSTATTTTSPHVSGVFSFGVSRQSPTTTTKTPTTSSSGFNVGPPRQSYSSTSATGKAGLSFGTPLRSSTTMTTTSTTGSSMFSFRPHRLSSTTATDSGGFSFGPHLRLSTTTSATSSSWSSLWQSRQSSNPFFGIPVTCATTSTSGRFDLFGQSSFPIRESAAFNTTSYQMQDEDVIFVSEKLPSAALQAKAKSLELPPTFYNYLDVPPCKGCFGCHDGNIEDFDQSI